ncbi:MAG TPA: hypothetical protein VKJ01_11050, partial [Candidatus Solibacter sp.]|nr:hypothetical protein [Candidatus Solibacter sp.]
LQEHRAIRVTARESAKARARELDPEIENKNQQQMQAYRAMEDAELFDIAWVHVNIASEDLPGYKTPRVVCAQCGEAVSFGRETVCDTRTLCRACAGESYYTLL